VLEILLIKAPVAKSSEEETSPINAMIVKWIILALSVKNALKRGIIRDTDFNYNNVFINTVYNFNII
jgi:hypothetical protein